MSELNRCKTETIGRSAIAVLGSECCYWKLDAESASSDEEVVNAAAPSLAMCPDGGLLLLGSSVYRRKGYMYSRWRQLHGKDDAEDICWLCPSRTMNSMLPENVVKKALAEDQPRAAAEYLSHWRSDIENYIAREVVEATISPGVYERAPLSDMHYSAFVDPSGGIGDSMVLAIGHREGDIAVLDLLREARPPFSPDEIVNEFASLLKRYSVAKVVGDRYGGEFVREPFSRAGITYDLSERSKSEIYREFLPMVNSGLVDLLASERLLNQLCNLERRSMRGGRESIDHAPNHRDDLANAASGVLVNLSLNTGYDFTMNWVHGDTPIRQKRNGWDVVALYQLGLVR